MSSVYQPFSISELASGINTYLPEWKRPVDAFNPLVNAYINRGRINKRYGYSQFGPTLADNNPVMGILNWIDPTTGIPKLLVATTVNLYLYAQGPPQSYTAIVLPSAFTGNISNFFNSTNWQPTSGSANLLWMTNDVDPITTYDGSVAAQPTITINGAGDTITAALDVKVYKQRLLYIRPVITSGMTAETQNQAIYWSATQNPTMNRVDVAGQGGFIEAPTGDILLSAEFIRDVLVVFFSGSTWIFRFTGNQSEPFRWDKVNNTKNTSTPYGTVAYDERCTSIGNTGLIACDGVNVQRYDIPIIDYYETNFSQKYFAQTFGQRYDNLNQSWMLYVSNEGGADPSGMAFPIVGGISPGSDSALVYNFLENSWATYQFQIPLTCMGLFYIQEGETWASSNVSPINEWQEMDMSWNSYGNQQSAPILLAGDTTGHVWHMDDQDEIVDYWYDSAVLTAIPIDPDIKSTRWNPLMNAAQKTQFGYLDIYYSVAFQPPETPVQVLLNFYVDNSINIAITKTLTLDGPVNYPYNFKRIYINLIGQFLQMEIDSNISVNPNSSMEFLGFILWVSPAGRLTGP